VAQVETYRVARHESSHDSRKQLIASGQQEMELIRKQTPGVKASARFGQELAQSPKKAA
jgi:hypothetical protein